MVPGEVYCAELMPRFDNTVAGVVLVGVSGDGLTLTIEGIEERGCPDVPYSFSADAHTMYR